MSENYGMGQGSMKCRTAEVGTITPQGLMALHIQLTDDDEWLERRVCGYKAIIVRYRGKEHSYTPAEVLVALDAARDATCRNCAHGHLTTSGDSCKWCSVIAKHDQEGADPDGDNGYDPEPYFDADFHCGFFKPKETGA